MKLSILIPVYNEVRTVVDALGRVLAVDYSVEMKIVVVEDGSTDGTRGKGAAIRTAARLATGTHLIICDAGLEYRPEEIPLLLHPVLVGEAEVVYGTRTFGSHTSYSFWYVMGNKAVTMFANVVFNSWISDVETCFKLVPLQLYRELDIRSNGFGMEAEVTGKLLRRGFRPYEVPLSYKARSREQGKKLTWKDGVQALWILLRARFGSRR